MPPAAHVPPPRIFCFLECGYPRLLGVFGGRPCSWLQHSTWSQGCRWQRLGPVPGKASVPRGPPPIHQAPGNRGGNGRLQEGRFKTPRVVLFKKNISFPLPLKIGPKEWIQHGEGFPCRGSEPFAAPTSPWCGEATESRDGALGCAPSPSLTTAPKLKKRNISWNRETYLWQSNPPSANKGQ